MSAGIGSVADSDADDPIVEEIPVYLSKMLLEQLFVFQYASKKFDFNFDNATVTQSSMKPLNQEAKIDFKLDSASLHYDAFKGEQFAIAADGQKSKTNKQPDQQVSFRSGTMDRQSFVSSRPLENIHRYVVGVFQDKEIHASPISGILQMRPSFSYFDKSDVRTKAEKRAENEADMDEEEAKQVTVQFARTENDNSRKAREKSFTYLAQRGADEGWCETKWFAKDSQQAVLERQKLFTVTNQPLTNSLTLANEEYIECLITKDHEEASDKTLVPSSVVCMAKLSLLSLSDQLQVILKDGKIVNFDRILELLNDRSMSAEKVLRTLPSVGILVQGNWTVLSEILYPLGSISGTNGVPAEIMCRARDYILFQLSKNEFIDRRKIATVTQIPPEEVKEILLTVARPQRSSGWQLLLPPDQSFEHKYQEQKTRQDGYWRAKEVKFSEMEADRSAPKRKRTRSFRSESGR